MLIRTVASSAKLIGLLFAFGLGACGAGSDGPGGNDASVALDVRALDVQPDTATAPRPEVGPMDAPMDAPMLVIDAGPDTTTRNADLGADLAADVAPPRVCPAQDGGVSTADAGRAATVDASPARGEVLFLVNKRVTVAGDDALTARLMALGFTVTTMQDADSKTEDATGKALILISASVSSGAIATKFRDVKVPVINMEPFVFDDLQMTAAVTGTDFEFAAGQTEIFVENARHPMAAGLRCAVTVGASAGQVTWAVPGANAETIATLINDARRHVIFAYKTGASMVGLAAPAARIGWFRVGEPGAVPHRGRPEAVRRRRRVGPEELSLSWPWPGPTRARSASAALGSYR